MPPTYELRVFSPAGSILKHSVDFLDLICYTQVNAPGILSVTLSGDHGLIPLLTYKSQIELWSKDPDNGIPWYRYFGGFYLAEDRTFTDHGEFILTAPGWNYLLGTRIVNWSAGTTARSKFTATEAETIAKTLVNYNAGSSATVANGRKREGAISGLSVEADGANGPPVDWFCFGENLLETLQKLVIQGGGDFDTVKTGDATWEFRWYDGQLGTDRSATLVFSMTNGNMANPKYRKNRIQEKTVACVWGQDAGSAREYSTVFSSGYTADNDQELYVDARDVDTADGRESRGNERLFDARSDEDFSFEVIQTAGSQYQLDYFLGDLGTVNNPFTGDDAVMQIRDVTLSLRPTGDRKVQIGLKPLWTLFGT